MYHSLLGDWRGVTKHLILFSAHRFLLIELAVPLEDHVLQGHNMSTHDFVCVYIHMVHCHYHYLPSLP